MNKAVSAFLAKHGFVHHVDINTVIDSLLFDMNNGLSGVPSDEDMICTWCTPPEKPVINKSVIVIDAGGTNFRSSLVSFDDHGTPSINFLQKTAMPGVERELGRKEFFDQIANNLEHLKDKAESIGFCFSYPMTITPDGDGILIGFSKEVKAPEVVGSHIGKCLKEALIAHGWKKIKNIVLLNDTVAALLAGAASPDIGCQYSSYMGLILGTGLNTAYIQSAISGKKDLDRDQIIVCEAGKFSHLIRSEFDHAVDSHTVKPGTFLMEKQCSGAYLGPLATEVLHTAAKEDLFSEKLNKKILGIEKLTLIEFDSFLHGPKNTSSLLGAACAECATDEDYDRVLQILDALVERSARYTAAMIAAGVIQSGKGTSALKPVCVLCDGTTFHKTHKIAARVEGYLEEVLTRQRGLYYQLIARDNDITLGAAICGLIER